MSASVTNLDAWKAERMRRRPQSMQPWRDKRTGEIAVIMYVDGDHVATHTGPHCFAGRHIDWFMKDNEPWTGPMPSWWKPSMAKRYGNHG